MWHFRAGDKTILWPPPTYFQGVKTPQTPRIYAPVNQRTSCALVRPCTCQSTPPPRCTGRVARRTLTCGSVRVKYVKSICVCSCSRKDYTSNLQRVRCMHRRSTVSHHCPSGAQHVSGRFAAQRSSFFLWHPLSGALPLRGLPLTAPFPLSPDFLPAPLACFGQVSYAFRAHDFFPTIPHATNRCTKIPTIYNFQTLASLPQVPFMQSNCAIFLVSAHAIFFPCAASSLQTVSGNIALIGAVQRSILHIFF